MAGIGSYSVVIITKDYEYIYFDGGLVFHDLHGINPPELRMSSYPSPLHDITYVNFMTYAPRKLTAIVHALCKDRCSVWNLRQDVYRAFNPLRGPFTLKLTLEDKQETYYLYDVILGDALDAPITAFGNCQYAEFPLSLLACDPRWYGNFAVNTYDDVDDYNEINASDTIVVGGNYSCRPYIMCRGPLDTVKITSDYNTDVFLELFAPVSAGETVTIDTRRGTVYNQLGVTKALTKESSMSTFVFAPTTMMPTGFNDITVAATGATPGTSEVSITVLDTYYSL